MSRFDANVIDLSQRRASRRRFLAGAAATGLAVPMFGSLGRLSALAQDARNSVIWISPRGTLEVLDDYPYWIAKQFGYFGDIETQILPGILESTSGAKSVAGNEADMSYVSPGVFADVVNQGLDLVSAWQMGRYDVFDFALPKGNPAGITTPKDLEGKTVVLGDIGWAAIVDPEIVQAGGDPSKVNYVAAGSGWAQTLQAGQADAALSWEGLRAQWEATGLFFDYILGYEWSVFPANSFQIRRKDFEDESLNDLYTQYLRGWAMGLEFAYQNPLAATQITMEAPDISAALTETFQDLNVAVESLWQLANVYRGKWDEGAMWGLADLDGWQTFFDASAQASGTDPVDATTVIFNDYVDGANDFDRDQVIKDATDFQLSEAFAAVPMPADAGLAAGAPAPEATPAG